MLKDEAILGRMEGDVFLILLKDCTTAEKVKDKVEQIREKLSSIYVGKEIERGCSVSVGAALYPKHGNEFHELLECARKALNLEKTKGVGRYGMYNEVFENVYDSKDWDVIFNCHMDSVEAMIFDVVKQWYEWNK